MSVGALSVGFDIGLGVAFGAISIIPLVADLFAPKKTEITTVRLYVGSTTGDLSSSLSGNLPGVALWDERGAVIGSSPGSTRKVAQGNTVDIEIKGNAEVGNAPAGYLALTNGGDDAICITGLAVTFPDETKMGFSGSVAASCGAQVFLSNRFFGASLPPPCFWLDRDNSLGLKFQGMGFHVRDFMDNVAQAQAFNKSTDLMCKSGPRFRMYEKLRVEDPILTFQPALEYTSTGVDKDTTKVINNPGVLAEQDETALRKVCEDQTTCKDLTAERCGSFTPPGNRETAGICSGRPKSNNKREPSKSSHSGSNGNTTLSEPATTITRNKPFDGSLVISSMEGHSARWLCNTENSWGPSFVSKTEKLFCDMEQKKLYDVCPNAIAVCCFDLEKSTLRQCGKLGSQSRIARTANRVAGQTRVYHKVQNWE